MGGPSVDSVHSCPPRDLTEFPQATTPPTTSHKDSMYLELKLTLSLQEHSDVNSDSTHLTSYCTVKAHHACNSRRNCFPQNAAAWQQKSERLQGLDDLRPSKLFL